MSRLFVSMGLVLRLAFRSFLRHGRRSLISGIAVALSLALMLFSVGIGTSSYTKMINMGVRMGSGHVVLEHPDFAEEQSASAAMDGIDSLLATAEKAPGAKYVAPRISSSGLVTHGQHSAAVLLTGVDPLVEVHASDIASKEKRVEGEYLRRTADLEFENTPGDVYLGAGLAEKLDAHLGDRIVITVAPPGGGDPRGAAFYVRGTFKTGVKEADRGMLQIDIAEARELLGIGAVATSIGVLLEDQHQVPQATKYLQDALGGREDVVVLPWQKALKELHDAIVVDRGGNRLMMSVIFIIVTIGIFNSILMSVTERTRELGVQKAVGTSGPRIFLAVVSEAAILAVSATALGLALGYGLHLWIADVGINVGAMMDEGYEVSGVAFSGYIYSELPLEDIIFWCSVTMSLVVSSAIYPAWRASRLLPVTAMRHV